MLFSQATIRQCKRAKIDVDTLDKDPELYRQVVDEAFNRLKKRVLVPAPSKGFDLITPPTLVDLKTSFVGRIVALLSTGETGVIIERPGTKCIVKLDKDGSNQKLCWDALYWLRRCEDADDAVAKIYKACCDVPQNSDISLGARVSVVKLNYQSGIVEKLPSSVKECCFMVRLDVSGQLVRSKAEGLRLITKSHPPIGPLFEKRGRPKTEEVRERRKQQKPEFIRPKSKSSERWLESLVPPKVLPPPRAVGDTVMSDDENDEEENENDVSDDELTLHGDENGRDNAQRQTEFLL